MAYQEFTWCPRTEPTGTNQYRVLEAQFGDGYRQSVGDGINNETRSWQLSFVGRESEIVPIRNFLRQHQGYMPFEWTPPLESKGLYEVRQFQVVPNGAGIYTLSATFDQRFEP